MARSAKTTKATPAEPITAARTAKSRTAETAVVPPAPAKGKARRAPPAQAAPTRTTVRETATAVPATAGAPTRVPPPSKGELRTQIEKLETANATLKAKSREGNRAAKVATRRFAALEEQVAQLQVAASKAPDPVVAREELEAAKSALQAKGREANRAAKLAERRIAELEAQIEQLEGEATKTAPPVVQEGEAKRGRRGRPPGRKNAIDPGDAVPPGVAVDEPEPMDPEAEAARTALEQNLSEAQVHEDE